MFSPLMKKPNPWEIFNMYLSVSEMAISNVLVLEEGRKHLLVNYVSKVMLDTKINYTWLEQLALAFTEMVKNYNFQSHTTIVLTCYPLRVVLHNSNSSGRLIKWFMALKQYDNRYQPSTTIKAQILGDFTAKITTSEGQRSKHSMSNWHLFVNVSSISRGKESGLF